MVDTELRLLLEVAALEGGTALQRNRRLPHPFDWDRLLALAGKHGMLALVSRALRFSGCELPPRIRVRLKESQEINQKSSLYLFGRLQELLNLLERADIPAIAFKGPVLSRQLYGDLALRQAGDLDLLVPPEFALQARKALISIGFRDELGLDEASAAIYLRSKCSYHFCLRQKDVSLELHWDIVPRFFVSKIRQLPIWSNLDQLNFAEGSIPCLGSEEHLLALCLHGGKDHWQRLIWVSDLSRLIQSETRLDWDRVAQSADRLSCRRLLLLGLLIAQRITPVRIPCSLAKAIKHDPELEKLFHWTFQQSWRSRRLIAANPRFQMRCREYYLDRWRGLLQLAFAPMPTDWKLLHLPRPLNCLYPFLRLLRTLVKYGVPYLKKRFVYLPAPGKPG